MSSGALHCPFPLLMRSTLPWLPGHLLGWTAWKALYTALAARACPREGPWGPLGAPFGPWALGPAAAALRECAKRSLRSARCFVRARCS